MTKDTSQMLNIFTWFGYSIPMEERFRHISAAGFDGVMLWWSDEFAEVDGDKTRHPEMARRHGLWVENLHAPFHGVSCLWDAGASGDAYHKMLAGCIEACAEHEVPTIVMHISHGIQPPQLGPLGLERLCRLVELAERKNVRIALENLRKLASVDYVLGSIQSDKLGFCYDSGHAHCYSPDLDLLSQYGSRLMALHLHDNDTTSDVHALPGDGTIDWQSIMGKIRGAGYAGAVSLEVMRRYAGYDPDEQPESYLQRAHQSASRLRRTGNRNIK